MMYEDAVKKLKEAKVLNPTMFTVFMTVINLHCAGVPVVSVKQIQDRGNFPQPVVSSSVHTLCEMGLLKVADEPMAYGATGYYLDEDNSIKFFEQILGENWLLYGINDMLKKFRELYKFLMRHSEQKPEEPFTLAEVIAATQMYQSTSSSALNHFIKEGLIRTEIKQEPGSRGFIKKYYYVTDKFQEDVKKRYKALEAAVEEVVEKIRMLKMRKQENRALY
ncbi:MAG TPA: hypothetical protein PLN03_13320 [Spirochaetota bacterium]|nr:hypothetical protein [Spirochaetota bacterium]HOK93787.1 hypothetical protein [Spirochaetota bacterium]